jgi:hypothetical protein
MDTALILLASITTSGDTPGGRRSDAAVDDPVRRRPTVKPGRQQVYR